MAVIRDSKHPISVLQNRFLSKNAKLLYLYLKIVPDHEPIKQICENLQIHENEFYEILDTLKLIGLITTEEEQ